MAEKIKDDPKNPLNSLMFGIGQPLKVYQENSNFNQTRFEGWSSDFLYYYRLGTTVLMFILTLPTIWTAGGNWMDYFWFWTMWSWLIALIAQGLSFQASRNPEYW